MGPNAVAPEKTEAIMAAVNSVNRCPFCTGLHGELGRMAHVQDSLTIMGADSITDIKKLRTDPEITYARVFAETDGRGAAEGDAYKELVKATSPAYATSVRALCWFLAWGSITGNTINTFLSRLAGKPKSDSNAVFELLFFVYYAPLFAVIMLLINVFHVLPEVPKVVSASIGMVLTVCASLWIATPGVIGIVVPFSPGLIPPAP